MNTDYILYDTVIVNKQKCEAYGTTLLQNTSHVWKPNTYPPRKTIAPLPSSLNPSNGSWPASLDQLHVSLKRQEGCINDRYIECMVTHSSIMSDHFLLFLYDRQTNVRIDLPSVKQHLNDKMLNKTSHDVLPRLLCSWGTRIRHARDRDSKTPEHPITLVECSNTPPLASGAYLDRLFDPKTGLSSAERVGEHDSVLFKRTADRSVYMIYRNGVKYTVMNYKLTLHISVKDGRWYAIMGVIGYDGMYIVRDLEHLITSPSKSFPYIYLLDSRVYDIAAMRDCVKSNYCTGQHLTQGKIQTLLDMFMQVRMYGEHNYRLNIPCVDIEAPDELIQRDTFSIADVIPTPSPRNLALPERTADSTQEGEEEG
jgi:hypothetical protein